MDRELEGKGEKGSLGRGEGAEDKMSLRLPQKDEILKMTTALIFQGAIQILNFQPSDCL